LILNIIRLKDNFYKKGEIILSLLGEELKRIRLENDYTIKYVANQTGVSQQYIRMLEKGSRENISFSILVKISNLYKIPLDYIPFIENPNIKRLSVRTLSRWYEKNKKTIEDFIAESKKQSTNNNLKQVDLYDPPHYNQRRTT